MSSSYENLDHISAVEAARQFGFTNDYITRLAREKKVVGVRVGREWFVDVGSVQQFVEESKKAKEAYRQRLRDERKRERESMSQNPAVQEPPVAPKHSLQSHPPVIAVASRAAVMARAGVVLCVSVIFGALLYSSATEVAMARQSAGVMDVLRFVAEQIYTFGDRERAEDRVVVNNIESRDARDHEEVANSAAVPDSSEPRMVDEGLIVTPLSTTSQNAQDVADSFSDEVRVVPDPGGKSGVVTPIFSNGSGTPYRYMMVPLHVAHPP